MTEFQKNRRGQYQKAFELITHGSPPSKVVIATDQMYRLYIVMEYLNRHTPEREFEYVWTKDLGDMPPNWMVQVTRYNSAPVQDYCLDGVNYHLVESFEHWGFSGAPWDVYRLAPERADGCVEEIYYPADHLS